MRIMFMFAGGVNYTVNATKDIALSVQKSMSNKESTLLWFTDDDGGRVEIIKGNVLYVEYKEAN